MLARSMLGSLRWFGLAALLSGCGMGELRAPLELAPDTLAIVVAFLKGGAPAAVSYAAADPPPALVLDDRGPLVALQYRESLSSLGLPNGALQLVAEGQDLPEPRSSWVLDYVPTPHWSESAALPDLAKRLKLPAGACSAEACQKAHGDPPSFSCSEDCPARVEPALPLPPAAPAALQRPRLGACRGASSAEDSAGVHWCSPPPRVRCAEGSWQGPDDDRCAPLKDCAAPPLIPTDALWVSPGATGGDGSRARPYGALSTALMNAPTGATISLVGAGHLFPVTLATNLRLVGACDSEIVIEADGNGVALRVDAADARVEGLSLAGRVVLEPNRALTLERAVVQGEVALGSGATLTVRRAAIAGPLALGQASVLRANDLSVQANVRAIDAAPGAEVELHDSVVQTGGDGPTIAASGATIHVERSLLLSERAALDLQAQSQAQIVDSYLGGAIVAQASVVSGAATVLRGNTPAALSTLNARVSLTDLLVTATSTTFNIMSSTVTMERIHVRTVGYTGLHVGSSSVTAVDLEMLERTVRILDSQGSAVRISRSNLGGVMGCEASSVKMSDVRSFNSTLRVLSGCSADLRRADWKGYFVVRPDHGNAALRLEDVAIDTGGAGNALSLDSDTLTELVRVSLVGARQGIDVRDGAELRGTDVDLDNSGGGIGLTLVGARVNLSRLRVFTRSDRPGLGALAANESEVRGSDWTIDGLRDQGLSFNTGSPVQLSRVKIANIAQAGLRMDEATLAPSSSGIEILDCGVGIELGMTTPWTEALANINLRRNRVPLSSR